MHRPHVRPVRHLGEPRPGEVPAGLLLRRAAAVGGPGRQRAPLPVPERPADPQHRPAAGAAGRRRGGVSGGHRGVHVVRGPVREHRRGLPAGDRAAAGAVRAAHRLAAQQAVRPAGVHLRRRAVAGPLQRAQLGLPRDGLHGGRRVRLDEEQTGRRRDAARPRRRRQDLPRLPRAAAADRADRRPGHPRRGPRCRRDGRGLARAEPAVRAGELGRLVGDVLVPGRPGRGPHDELDLVLGLPGARRGAGQPVELRADRRVLAGRADRRLVGRAADRQLPVDPGERVADLRVPAVQQGLLPAVRAVAAAVLRAGAGALGLVGGVPGGRPRALPRPVPLVLRHHPGRRLRRREAGRGDRGVGQGGAARPALRGVPDVVAVDQVVRAGEHDHRPGVG